VKRIATPPPGDGGTDRAAAFHFIAKDVVYGEIENPAFTGRPKVTVSRLVQEADVVLAECTVEAQMAGGSAFSAAFRHVFEVLGANIRRLIGLSRGDAGGIVRGQSPVIPLREPDDAYLFRSS
jgi:hypothetical protein